jgi:hypothetical protein
VSERERFYGKAMELPNLMARDEWLRKVSLGEGKKWSSEFVRPAEAGPRKRSSDEYFDFRRSRRIVMQSVREVTN